MMFSGYALAIDDENFFVPVDVVASINSKVYIYIYIYIPVRSPDADCTPNKYPASTGVIITSRPVIRRGLVSAAVH